MQSNQRSLLLIGVLSVGLLTGLLIGYNTAVIAGALLFLKNVFNLSPLQQGLVVSIILIGGFFGALSCHHIIEPFGQRKTLLFITILFIISTICCALSKSFDILLAGRFLLGIAVGMSTVVGPMYVAEAAPDKWRGFYVGSVQLAITIGIFSAYLSNYYYSESHNWQMMFALGVVPALLLFWVVIFQPESPRWLLLHGHSKEAKAIYFRLQGVAWNVGEYHGSSAQSKSNLRTVLQPMFISVALFSCGLFFFQNLSGIDAVLYYAPSIFEKTGFSSTKGTLEVTLLLGFTNIIATMLSMILLDKVGRRSLLIYGLALMFLSLFCFSHLSYFPPHLSKWLSVALLMIFITTFAMSLGPIPYVLMTELFPLSIRSYGLGLAAATAWGINGLITLVYPILEKILGLMTIFVGFSLICLIALIITLLYCPETKQQSLESIEAKLKLGVPLRELGE
jgi:MFS transporter, SP family, galactose:H+ symporter